MSPNQMEMNRRESIKIFFWLFATASVMGIPKVLLGAQAPLPPGSTAVPETDPVAVAIGYKSNVKDIDYTKYPLRKKADAKNQFCKNCALYTPVNDSWGKCQMLTSGLVTSLGWCGSWSKKG